MGGSPSDGGSGGVCSGLKSHLRITAWAGLPLMDALVRANTECCVLLGPLGTKPGGAVHQSAFVDSNALILSGLAEGRSRNTGRAPGASDFECPQNLERLRGIGTNREVCVHIGCTNNPFLVDHVPRGHRQSVSRLIVEPVQRATEVFVKSAQVIRQYKYKPKLLRGLEVKIRQDVERQVQLLVEIARVPLQLRSQHHDLRSGSLNL